MFLVFLLETARCDWWEFNETEFQDKMKNSWDEPLYALCYSVKCPQCFGLPERFKAFSSIMAERGNVTFTAIEVNNTKSCGKLGATNLPYFVFVRGRRRKYWLRPNFQCPLRWIEFVTEWANPTAKEQSFDEFVSTLNSTQNGGSAFFMETFENSSDIELFKDLSTKYHIMNVTFGYSISQKTETKLTVFKSPKCKHVFDSGHLNITEIVDKHKFSSFHHYDRGEYRRTMANENMFLLMNNGSLKETENDLIGTISAEFCDSLTLGWGELHEDKRIGPVVGVTSDTPYTVTTRTDGCRFANRNIENATKAIEDIKSYMKARTCVRYPEYANRTNPLLVMQGNVVMNVFILVFALIITIVCVVIYWIKKSDKKME